MKFEILRDSDFIQGRGGDDVPQPIPSAAFNAEENRWEVELESLDALMTFIGGIGEPVIITPVCDACGDHAVLLICDIDKVPEERESGTRVTN